MGVHLARGKTLTLREGPPIEACSPRKRSRISRFEKSKRLGSKEEPRGESPGALVFLLNAFAQFDRGGRVGILGNPAGWSLGADVRAVPLGQLVGFGQSTHDCLVDAAVPNAG